jgi:hypothetical protein
MHRELKMTSRNCIKRAEGNDLAVARDKSEAHHEHAEGLGIECHRQLAAIDGFESGFSRDPGYRSLRVVLRRYRDGFQ